MPESEARGHGDLARFRDALAERARRRRFRKGAVAVSEGDESDSLFLVLSGAFRVVQVEPGGKEFLLGTLTPGDFFGEIALFTGGRRSADVVALEDAEALEIGRARFLAFLAEFPDLALGIIEYLARRVQQASRTATDLATRDVVHRVARVLANQGAGDATGWGSVRLSHGDIAGMVGASRPAVTQAMGLLREAGCVAQGEGPRRLRVHYPALRRFLGD